MARSQAMRISARLRADAAQAAARLPEAAHAAQHQLVRSVAQLHEAALNRGVFGATSGWLEGRVDTSLSTAERELA
jgi:hypothetical protein